MTNLLIELLTEEIPARFQAGAEQNFADNIADNLKQNGLEYAEIKSYSTPRRLAVIVSGLPDKQPDINEERKGPKVGSPEQALNGFLNSVGATMDDLVERDGVYYFTIDKKGGNTADVLPEIINKSITDIHWANSMRFANSDFRFVRPLQRIVATFGVDLVAGTFAVDKTEIAYTDKTTGHRFTSNEDINVNAENYVGELQKRNIIVSRETRQTEIENQLTTAIKGKSITLIDDKGLMDEVVGLVETPVVLIGEIEDRFMKLPKEVLVKSMREHQKFFAFEDSKGNLAPYFATVANIQASDGGSAIVAGNQRVLRARLADSEFFYDNDLKTNLADFAPKLEKMTFHEKLGSMAQRVKRMTELSGYIAEKIGADVNDTKRATELCKCDLVSQMVGEFASLQGIMGGYYASRQGENENVSSAIATHYQPQGANDNIPTVGEATALAIAEKLDTLTGFWLIDEKPTGSKDPYALRRCALGIIRMILENDLRIDLAEFIKTSTKLHSVKGDITNDLLSFFADRVKAHLKTAGIRHDFISAVLSSGITDLPAQVKLAEELSNNADVVAQVKESYTRAKNITEKIDNLKFGAVDESLLSDKSETDLHNALNTAKTELKSTLQNEDFKQSVAVIANLAPVLNIFFESVMVNDENEKIRTNRLNILGEIIETVNLIADFSVIEG